MAACSAALKLEGGSTLVATAEYDVNVYKSARNIAACRLFHRLSDLNALRVLQAAADVGDEGGFGCDSPGGLRRRLVTIYGGA